MSIDIQSECVPPEVMADLEDAARYAASGIRDPEVMRRACERMDRMREESGTQKAHSPWAGTS